MEFYLVSAGSGSYDDYTESPVGLFPDKESAKAYCKAHNAAEDAESKRVLRERKRITNLPLAKQELLVADPAFQKEYWQMYSQEWLWEAYEGDYDELRNVTASHHDLFIYYLHSYLDEDHDSSYYHCSSYPVPVL